MTDIPLLPPLFLVGDIESQSIQEISYWTGDDVSDPWYGLPYRWKIRINFDVQVHSAYTSRLYMVYTAKDIQVNSWIADIQTGRSLKIIGIDGINTNDNYITCYVEDVDRYNLLTSPYQDGTGLPYLNGKIVAFNLAEDGLPILAPISLYSAIMDINNNFLADLTSRFRYRNTISQYHTIKQPGHIFKIKDPIYLRSDGKFMLANNIANANKIIGHVTQVNTPGIDYFSFKPINPIQKIMLPGFPGDIIYLDYDNPNNYIATPPLNKPSVPCFIKLSATTAIPLERNAIPPKQNLEATTSPTMMDDLPHGYNKDSLWFNKLTGEMFICIDGTVNNAVWVKVNSTAIDMKYKHEQLAPNMNWIVVHNKNSYDFTYNIYDFSGKEILPNEILSIDSNTINVQFTVPIHGKAIFNFV